MRIDSLRPLILALTAATHAAAGAAGIRRGLAESPLPTGPAAGTAQVLLAGVALALGLCVAAAALRSGRWRSRPAVPAAAAAAALLMVPLLLTGRGAAAWWLIPFPVAAALLSSWLLVSSWIEGGRPSARTMFRSQWQVPLHAAEAAFIVVVLGAFLGAVNRPAVCTGFPLCGGLAVPRWDGVVLAHLLHRTAAAMAGIFLAYTVWFVWRRHLHRPVLLLLAGLGVVAYATVAVLGAQAARGELGPTGSGAHLLAATVLIGILTALAALGYHAPSLPAIAGASAAAVLPAARPWREVARDYVALTKPRILLLLILTGYAAMWVAAGGPPDPVLAAAAMAGLAMACGAANAINMWFDRDIDGIMARTRNRPVPAGRLTAAQALGFGILTGALAYLLLAAAVNLLAALLALAGLLFYVCIYTMRLKRSTAQNIVIGGVAGAVPPLVGWAAVTGEVGWAAVVMFLIVFVWTPPHFWALALFRNEDYRRAGVPMLPVVRGEAHTKWQILLYSALMGPVAAALYWTGAAGRLYLAAAVAGSLAYLAVNLRLFRERLPAHRWAVRSFAGSILWLGVIFLAMVLDVHA